MCIHFLVKQMKVKLEETIRDDEKLQGLDAAMKMSVNKMTSSIIDKCIPHGLVLSPFNV